jgi:STE24 endopeptidase
MGKEGSSAPDLLWGATGSDLPSGSESPFEDRAEELGSGRGFSGLTIGMLIPVVAIWLVSLLCLVPVGALFGVLVGNSDTGVVVVCIGWTLGAGLVFIRPVEERLGNALFRLRPPTAHETKMLQPLWSAVCKEAAVDPNRYILKVENSRHPNSQAAAGRIVAVTTGALEQLPADMLQGILAHELGHHRDMRPIIALLTWWYLLPILFLDWCLRIVVQTSTAISDSFTGWLTLISSLALLGLLLARFLFLIPVRIAHVFGMVMARASEYRADRYAAESGHGPGLVHALELFLTWGFDDDRPVGIDRLYNTHPPLQKRIRALERRMEKLGSGRQPDDSAVMTWRLGA